jgi:hypothetical protein
LKEIKINYYLNGEKVEKECIDWTRTMTILLKGKEPNTAHISYRDEPSKAKSQKGLSTRAKAADVCPNGIGYQEERDIDAFVKMAEQYELRKCLNIEEDVIEERKKEYKHISLSEIFPWLLDLSEDEKDAVSTPHIKTSGVKHNIHKAPLDIVQTRQFPKALQLVALATAFGHHKYFDTDKHYTNFKNVEGGAQTYLDAAARHNTNRGETDKDSGLHHIIHSVWNNLAALELWIEEQVVDVENYSKTYLENLHKNK